MAINLIGNTGTPPPKPAVRESAPAQAVQGANVPTIILPDAAAPPQQPKAEDLRKAVETMRQLVESKAPNSLQFSIDDATGKTIVKITDAKTGEMIRQIPSEEMLDIARSLDRMQGILLKQEA